MSFFFFDPPGCVFIRIRKAGSTSVIRGLFGDKSNARRESSDGTWYPEFDGRFVFAFVRNPFSRMISCLQMFRGYKTRTLEEQRFKESLTLDRLMDVIEDEKLPIGGDGYMAKLRLHAVPMTHPFYCIDRAEYIGRFERFEQDYREVARLLGIRVWSVPHERKSAPMDYRPWFSAAQRRRAERLLAADLDRFGYRFE
ncbi:sulfotransferase family 2 domain-containing protein [Azohydromonas sediminis]|uniref:sulfotransferase family 2 domain-containing protein n=1 Tax=Azohydromonas sediminis TaxID=2259674 RepID=UPI000E658759|nr:sulfotransferase family 2 domain-containing protein [Azohydromonas sediminis]